MAELDGALGGWIGVRHRENYILAEKIACVGHTRGKGLDGPAASTGKIQTHATAQPLGHESPARMFRTLEARGRRQSRARPAGAPGTSSVTPIILRLQPTAAVRHPASQPGRLPCPCLSSSGDPASSAC